MGDHARERARVLSRGLDEPRLAVRRRHRARLAAAHDRRALRRRRLLHEPGHADGRAAARAAEPQAFRAGERLLRLDQRAADAVSGDHGLCRDGARRRHRARPRFRNARRPRAGARRNPRRAGLRVQRASRRAARPPRALAAARRPGGEIPLRPLSRAHRRPEDLRRAVEVGERFLAARPDPLSPKSGRERERFGPRLTRPDAGGRNRP